MQRQQCNCTKIEELSYLRLAGALPSALKKYDRQQMLNCACLPSYHMPQIIPVNLIYHGLAKTKQRFRMCAGVESKTTALL